MLDLQIARALGFERPRVIRELIRRNLTELESYGLASRRVAQVSAGIRGTSRMMEVSEYLLSQPQAVLIATLSRTPGPADVREMLIRVFMAWRASRAEDGDVLSEGSANGAELPPVGTTILISRENLVSRRGTPRAPNRSGASLRKPNTCVPAVDHDRESDPPTLAAPLCTEHRIPVERQASPPAQCRCPGPHGHGQRPGAPGTVSAARTAPETAPTPLEAARLALVRFAIIHPAGERAVAAVLAAVCVEALATLPEGRLQEVVALAAFHEFGAGAVRH